MGDLKIACFVMGVRWWLVEARQLTVLGRFRLVEVSGHPVGPLLSLLTINNTSRHVNFNALSLQTVDVSVPAPVGQLDGYENSVG